MSIPPPPALQNLLADEAVQQIFRLLDTGADCVRLVGGVVRNALMQRPVTDIDMATTHLPQTVMDKAIQAGIKAVPTGLAHGTVTLVIAGRSFEITTLREDIDTHGRHATVRFGRDFTHDARRRDFTINALYADAKGVIYDYTEGLDDLAARRVRFIGTARTRIEEDYLRILRFFRFFSDYGEGPIDPDGLNACIALREGLQQLSHERIGSECLKILTSRRATEAVVLMEQAGILALILPHRIETVPFGHLLALAPEADAMTRLAALTHPDQADVQGLRDSLRLSNQQSQRLEQIVRAIDRLDHSVQTHALHETAFRQGHAVTVAALMVIGGRQNLSRDWLDGHIAQVETVPTASPFSGRALLARGLEPGPGIGQIVAEAERLWIDSGFAADPDALLARAVKHIHD